MNVSLPHTFRCAIMGALFGLASSAALAAPYAITYTGTIEDSTYSGIIDGQSYTVTLVFDNEGTTAASQTWSDGDLTCAIWRMNNARNVSVALDLVSGIVNGTGTTETNASGQLTSVFSDVSGTARNSGEYTASGITLTPDIDWYANAANYVLHDTGSGGRSFGDASGGVQMTTASWSAPIPFTGDCRVTPPPPVTVTAVPALDIWGLGLLATVAGALGLRARRRS